MKKYTLAILSFLFFTSKAYAVTLYCTDTTEENFVPSYSSVNIAAPTSHQGNLQYYEHAAVHATFYWHEWNRLKWLKTTWESTLEMDIKHDNSNYAAIVDQIAGAYTSNLPKHYADTPFLDGDDVRNLSIGSAKGWDIKEKRTYYYSYVAKKVHPVNPSTGNYGPAFHYALFGNTNLPANKVTMVAQRGRRAPEWCYSTWCSYGCNTSPNFVETIKGSHNYYPPGNAYVWYNYVYPHRVDVVN